MNGKYILNDSGKPVPAWSIEAWGRWFETADRTVAKEKVGDCEVSTVFLAMDHRFADDGPPILWETMVFGGKLDQEQDRCSGSREQAEAMHARMVQRVKEAAV